MSISDVPNSMALPNSVQMKLRPNAVPAVRKRLNIQPYTKPTGAITSNQLIQFYVPARRNTMYDPQTMYIRGTISAATGGAAGTRFLNRNAFSVINRLQVYGQDSTLLEDIQNYNNLCHTLLDIQMGVQDKYALSSMYAGNDNTFEYTVTIPASGIRAGGNVNLSAGGTNAVTATVDGNDGIFRSAGVANGTACVVAFPNLPLADVDATVTQTSVIDIGFNIQGNSINFCIPVVSAFGLLADTMIPIGWLNSDLRFDFYTELPNIAFRNTAPAAVTGYQLSNLELVVDTVEFDPSAMQMITQIAPVQGPLFCHATTYKTYTSTYANATASSFQSNLIPHRSLSVKQLLVSSLPVYNSNGYDSFARVNVYGTTNYSLQLSIGGLKFPQKSIEEYSEAFAELQKSQHSFNQLILNGSINRTEYRKYGANIGAVGDELSCKNALGFDLETYDKKGTTIINGQNWTGLNVFIEGIISDSEGTAQLTHAHTNIYYVNYDCIYVIQDGTISVRF